MSRLAWAAARQLLSGLFPSERDGGPAEWPARLAPVHLARLQSPPVGKDYSGARVYQAAIEAACQAGELAHTSETFAFPPVIFGLHETDSPAVAHAKWLAQHATMDLPAIAADDFARWLESEGADPSVHVRAWFAVTANAEAPAQRQQENATEKRARLLTWFEEEERERGLHGAIQRTANRAAMDRGNCGKAIKKARQERDEARRSGALRGALGM